MTDSDTPAPAELPAAEPAAGRRPRPYLDLLLISFLILFFELACIRWFGATVIFLTFFTNIVLMACFLGMSVGCFAASRRANLMTMVLPLSALAAVLAAGVFWGYQRYSGVTIDVGNQASPQVIYFGTEYRPRDIGRFVIPLWAVAGLFFTLIALIFVGLGQVMGRAFDVLPNRVAAYTTNVLGSLLGIAGFFAASWLGTSPHVWFLVCVALALYFVPRWTPLQVGSQLLLLAVIAATAYGVMEPGRVLWSPYYKIHYTPQTGDIVTNNISHQTMFAIGEKGPAYALPHLLNRDAGRPPFENVLIIGAGSGNDVQAALRYGAKHIDAVEIDPAINAIGKADHPDRPFDDPRVTVHYDDGRRFLKRNPGRKYDLIVYALVDSLVLHSGYSSLRLESFLFTQEAFHDIRRRLDDDGVFVMYNYFRQGWVVGRLHQMVNAAFAADPLVMSMPRVPGDAIAASDNQGNHITFFLAGPKDHPLQAALRQRLTPGNYFWINATPKANDAIKGFGPAAPAGPGEWRDFALTRVDTADLGPLPTDNWPFLYLRKPSVPFAPSIQGIIVIAVLSLVILLSFAPLRAGRAGFDGRMFFLGAGFMLLETKGVVHMALLFGSTWVVNSVVFAAILVMILLANLYVLALRPRRLWPYYALLVIALAVNVLVPMTAFLNLSDAVRPWVSCAVIFVPIFFAGVIFAASFRDTTRPDVAMGSNIAGVILGGLCEYLSLMIGFQWLVLVAIAFYALSAVLTGRRAPALALEPAPAL